MTLDGRVDDPGRALDLRRGEPPARPRAAGAPRTPSRSAWARCAPTGRASTHATSAPSRQPRRLAFGRGPLPDDSELELRTGPLADELAALAAEGVQSLLLEGGPRIAAAFLREGLLDKLLVFVAREARRRGARGSSRARSPAATPQPFHQPTGGGDVLLTAYVNEP